MAIDRGTFAIVKFWGSGAIATGDKGDLCLTDLGLLGQVTEALGDGFGPVAIVAGNHDETRWVLPELAEKFGIDLIRRLDL
jgi:hypothetical protein